jgi:hypothetical protein
MIAEGMDRALGNWKVRRILISEARILRAERVMVMEEEQEDVDIVTINLPQVLDGGISGVMAVIGGVDIQVEVALTIDEKVQEDNTFILLDAQGEPEIDYVTEIDDTARDRKRFLDTVDEFMVKIREENRIECEEKERLTKRSRGAKGGRNRKRSNDTSQALESSETSVAPLLSGSVEEVLVAPHVASVQQSVSSLPLTFNSSIAKRHSLHRRNQLNRNLPIYMSASDFFGVKDYDE